LAREIASREFRLKQCAMKHFNQCECLLGGCAIQRREIKMLEKIFIGIVIVAEVLVVCGTILLAQKFTWEMGR